MSEWNRALDAAIEAAEQAPVFPVKDGGGPRMDAERLIVISLITKEIEKLRRPTK